jgi:hypothetical protein
MADQLNNVAMMAFANKAKIRSLTIITFMSLGFGILSLAFSLYLVMASKKPQKTLDELHVKSLKVNKIMVAYDFDDGFLGASLHIIPGGIVLSDDSKNVVMAMKANPRAIEMYDRKNKLRTVFGEADLVMPKKGDEIKTDVSNIVFFDDEGSVTLRLPFR